MERDYTYEYEYFTKEKKRAKKLHKKALKNYNKTRMRRLTNRSTIDDVLKAQEKVEQEYKYYIGICRELKDIENGTFGDRYKEHVNGVIKR